ncbi:MAG: transposase [Candidatus Kuenenbacteria bacterium]
MPFKNFPKFQEGIHFITTKTFKNYSYFKDEKCCLILVEELDFYRKKLGFKILGYTIMPDHLHCLIWWDIEKYPELTINYIIQRIKSHSAKKILEYLNIYLAGRRHP